MIPIKIAPGTRRTNSTAVRMRPTIAISAALEANDPSVTNVAGLVMTRPAFLSPMKARNIPMPAVTEYLRWCGTARTIAWRTPSTERRMKMQPEIATAPSAVCHGIFCPRTTVKAKYALSPMPGACANG